METRIYILFILITTVITKSIEEFGAVHDDDSYEATLKNQNALNLAFNFAHQDV